MDAWNLFMKKENSAENLSRFLIAFDELRARLVPSRYPNLEITDEGCLWFNIYTPMGIAEIIGIPFGFKELETPSIIFSFPREAEEINLSFLNKLRQVTININGTTLFAAASPADETLEAYRQNIQPPLTIARKLDEILDMKKKGVFFSYLGIVVNIADKEVSEIENTIKTILFEMKATQGRK